jgi:hypothetical protein
VDAAEERRGKEKDRDGVRLIGRRRNVERYREREVKGKGKRKASFVDRAHRQQTKQKVA